MEKLTFQQLLDYFAKEYAADHPNQEIDSEMVERKALIFWNLQNSGYGLNLN